MLIVIIVFVFEINGRAMKNDAMISNTIKSIIKLHMRSSLRVIISNIIAD